MYGTTSYKIDKHIMAWTLNRILSSEIWRLVTERIRTRTIITDIPNPNILDSDVDTKCLNFSNAILIF